MTRWIRRCDRRTGRAVDWVRSSAFSPWRVAHRPSKRRDGQAGFWVRSTRFRRRSPLSATGLPKTRPQRFDLPTMNMGRADVIARAGMGIRGEPPRDNRQDRHITRNPKHANNSAPGGGMRPCVKLSALRRDCSGSLPHPPCNHTSGSYVSSAGQRNPSRLTISEEKRSSQSIPITHPIRSVSNLPGQPWPARARTIQEASTMRPAI